MSETPPELPDSCWPIDTACVSAEWDAWLTTPDPTANPPVVGVPKYTAAEKARATALAGQTMRMLTGYRVGGCPVTVRPCAGQPCGCRPTVARCDHLGGREVRLGAQVGTVVAVVIGGATLDPSAYRLDSGGRLVRMDGDVWPARQDLAAPLGDADTWSVTYYPGAAVDGLGAAAAGRLALEYVKACSGGDCKLPSTVTQVVRNGVTITRAPGAFPDGKTGIKEVDAWIARWNPHQLSAPSMAYSPDLPVHRSVQDSSWSGLPPMPGDNLDGGTP